MGALIRPTRTPPPVAIPRVRTIVTPLLSIEISASFRFSLPESLGY
jgi:hypothetical protein